MITHVVSFFNLLLRLQRLVMILCSGFIITAVAAVAFQRYVFEGNLYGIEEYISFAAFWMYFMGASYATHIRSHISAEVFSIYCTHEPTRIVVSMLRSIITLGLCLLFTVWGWEFFYWSLTEGGKTTVWQMPLVIGHSSVFVGFIMMSWYFLVELLSDLAKAMGWDVKLLNDLNPQFEDDKALLEETKLGAPLTAQEENLP